MLRYRCFWSIPNAGPSVSTFYLDNFGGGNLPVAVAAIRAFFSNRAPLLPNEVTISFDTAADSIEPTTGALIGTAPVTAPAPVTGTGAGVWSAGAGVRIDWLTDAFRNGRRVRGRTFMVPAVSGAFGSDGRVLPAQITATDAAATTMLTALSGANLPLTIWSRPDTGIGGNMSVVGSAATSGLAATLRGRKY